MDVAQPIAGDVSIKFRRADGGVTEHFLNDPQVGAMLKQMGRETMAKHVRRDIA